MSEDGAWLRTAYSEYQANIRWAKERSSNVTYWSVVLAFGIAATSTQTGPDLDAWLVGSILAVGLFSCWWLWDLHCFAAKCRRLALEFLEPFPRGYGYPEKEDSPSDHPGHLVAYGLAVIGSAIVAGVVVAQG